LRLVGTATCRSSFFRQRAPYGVVDLIVLSLAPRRVESHTSRCLAQRMELLQPALLAARGPHKMKPFARRAGRGSKPNGNFNLVVNLRQDCVVF